MIKFKQKKLSTVPYYAGRVAADTLGFIGGNLPGALIADTVYSNTYQKKNQSVSMAGRRRRRSVGSSNPLAGPPRQRRRNSFMARAWSNPANWTRVARPRARVPRPKAALGNNVQAGRGPNKIAKRRKGPKTIKVSKRLKKAIKQTIRNFSPKGFYSERFFKRYIPVQFNQTVCNLGEGCFAGETAFSKGLSGSGSIMFFDPLKILDAASVLYKGKAFTGVKDITNPGQFDVKTFMADVMRQWVQINIKNNTARVITLKLWTWNLKGNKEIGSTGGNQNFTDEWTNAALAEGSSSAGLGKVNVQSVGITEIGMTPQLSPAMKRKFSMEEKIVELEPGKTFLHYVQGPSMMYEFAKYLDSGIFNNYQNMCKGVCLAFYTDLIAGSTQPAGETQRLTGIADPTGAGLLVETVYNYVIRLPEQTGFILTTPVTTTPGNLDIANTRRLSSVYAIKTWDKVALNGTPMDLEDEDPGSLMAPGTG